MRALANEQDRWITKYENGKKLNIHEHALRFDWTSMSFCWHFKYWRYTAMINQAYAEEHDCAYGALACFVSDYQVPCVANTADYADDFWMVKTGKTCKHTKLGGRHPAWCKVLGIAKAMR